MDLNRIISLPRDRAAAVMSDPGRFPFFSAATLLTGISLLYGCAVRLRNRLYDSGIASSVRLTCPVVSIGNLVVGGTGKTPMALYLANRLLGWGFRPAVVSRGYKGRAERSGAIVSDGRKILCEARQAGDEPYLIASACPGVPVVVGRDRAAAARSALGSPAADLIILDDGFQHRRLERDLNFVLLDAGAPFGNGCLFPRGTLREPPKEVLRADAVILTRCPDRDPVYLQRLCKVVAPRPVFRAALKPFVHRFVPAGSPMHAARKPPEGIMVGKRVLAFSGLARNAEFQRSIRTLGGRLKATRGFADHHWFDATDIAEVSAAARAGGVDCLATTMKDFVRLPAPIELPLDVLVLDVAVAFGADETRLHEFLMARLINAHPAKGNRV